MTRPLVSIGLPVFNGEKTLARALDALLGQEFVDFELIISDNASTDATARICEEYAARDPRIRYIRAEKNQGALWNFNRVFDLSAGTYFMWAAHDDHREPGFVRECVEMLEANPGAVLCHTHTVTLLEGSDVQLSVAGLESFADVHDVVERYRETLKHFPATAIYGIYRASAVRETQRLRKSIATDIAFVQELSIHGDFIEVPKPLFTYYVRPAWNTIHDDYRAFFGVAKKPWWYLPFVVLFMDHWNRIGASKLPLSLKVQLWSALLEHETARLALRLLIRAGGIACPSRWKDALGDAVYWRWLHSPNVRVLSPDVYRERVIKPVIGWSR